VAGFIAAQRADHGIPHAVSCRALGVSEGWFYKWKDGDRSPRRARRERLKAEIRRLFAAHKGKRGSPMITADLRDLGWRVSKNTVAAVMAEMGLAARPNKRRQGTTRPGKGRWRAVLAEKTSALVGSYTGPQFRILDCPGSSTVLGRPSPVVAGDCAMILPCAASTGVPRGHECLRNAAAAPSQ